MGSSQGTLECSCHPPLSLVSLYILDYGFDPREHHQLLSKVHPVSWHRTFGQSLGILFPVISSGSFLIILYTSASSFLSSFSPVAMSVMPAC